MSDYGFRTRNPLCFFILVGFLFFVAGCGETTHGPPYAPEEAVSTLEVAEGFRVELFASEPLLRDPVAIEVDEQGLVYVAEDPGYQELNSGKGQVSVLIDTDGDGYPDESTVFADDLDSPRGVMRWKEGLLVTDAPEVYYFEDTDGDYVADERRVVLTGFGNSNPQLGVNTPLYGPDNWIYLAHRYTNDNPRFADEPETDRNLAGDIRFRPETKEIEALSVRTQFGHTFDQWGRRLSSSNSNHIFQEIIAARYLARNPDLTVGSITEMISDHGAAAQVFPITENPEYQLFTDAGVMTSACGLTCYMGDLFPENYRGAAFVAENVHNLVHVDSLSGTGPALEASRMSEDREFLASTDSWFRPVNFYVGPDGALYVIDYYRDIIEQQRFLSEEVIDSGRLYSGSDRGRIYRVVPENADDPSWVSSLDLAGASTGDLVEYLDDPNIWWRRTAQRLLVDREDASARESLEALAGGNGSGVGQMHALWTLDGLGELSSSSIVDALNHPEAGVRENAIRLAELHLSEMPELADALLAMGDEPNDRVRFQLLATLGDIETERAQTLRQELLFGDLENRWMQIAGLSAADIHPMRLYQTALGRLTDRETMGRRTFFEQVSALIGARQNSSEIARVIQEVTSTSTDRSVWWRTGSIGGLAAGMRGKEWSESALIAERNLLLETFFENESTAVREAYLDVFEVLGLPEGSVRQSTIDRAVTIIPDRDHDAQLRADAIRLVAMGAVEPHEEMLRQLISSQAPAPVQAAAVEALGKLEAPRIADFLLSRWNLMTPEIRSLSIDVLMQSARGVRLLLGAIDEGTVQPSTVGRSRVKSLMLHDNPELQKRARTLLADRGRARQEVVDRYRQVLEQEGDRRAGQQIYARACARCHQLGGGGGVAFGPDLATVKNRSQEWLLTHILRPNKSIADGYEFWRINRLGGDAVEGIISSETASAVTVIQENGQEVTIARSQIQSMNAVGASAMPEGLEEQIDREEMADLLAYIKQGS
jgi:putative membrane-bound dehydrogenase-like protein